MTKSNAYTSVAFKLPTLMFVRNVNGEAINVDWSKVPEEAIGLILQSATKVLLNNSFNTGGKDTPEVERLAKMQKKIDAWYRGEVNVVERGDSDMTAMKDQFIDEQVAATGKSRNAIERMFASKVEAVFGEKSNSFDRFLSAVATEAAKANDGDMEATKRLIVAKLWERTQAAQAERAKAASEASLDLSGLLG